MVRSKLVPSNAGAKYESQSIYTVLNQASALILTAGRPRTSLTWSKLISRVAPQPPAPGIRRTEIRFRAIDEAICEQIAFNFSASSPPSSGFPRSDEVLTSWPWQKYTSHSGIQFVMSVCSQGTHVKPVQIILILLIGTAFFVSTWKEYTCCVRWMNMNLLSAISAAPRPSSNTPSGESGIGRRSMLFG